jgi:Uma2 family endonuclease
MAGDPAVALHPLFPNLPCDVAEGYLHAPDTMVAEVVNGELSLMPRPRRQHAFASGEMYGELRGLFQRRKDGPGGWVFLPEPELHLGSRPDVVVPDVAGWRREHLPDDFMAETAPPAIDLHPDWLCEVLSSRTAAYDRGAKMRVYHREKVTHIWLVDPSVRTLEVFRWSADGYVLVETFVGEVAVRAEPFDAMELHLATLWNL